MQPRARGVIFPRSSLRARLQRGGKEVVTKSPPPYTGGSADGPEYIPAARVYLGAARVGRRGRAKLIFSFARALILSGFGFFGQAAAGGAGSGVFCNWIEG